MLALLVPTTGPIAGSATPDRAAGASARATATDLDVIVSNLRSAKGDVLVCLTADPKRFPDCSGDSAARKLVVDAGDAGRVRIEGVVPGTYAIALVHDENANGRMDMRLFLPREGFGFSRNPKIGMGPPKFGAAKFAVTADGASSRAVRMKYIL